MANLLLERLRENDKDGLFDASPSVVCYPTGIDTLDHQLGYTLVAKDLDDNIIDTHDSLGLVGGSFVTIIGKSGTAKTALACRMGASITKPFNNAFTIHYDLEQALTATRVKNLTGLTNREYLENYILKSSRSYIEDITDTIMEIVHEKKRNKKDYQYTTDFKDEFGQPITLYQPTVFIIDSIPVLAMRPDEKKVKAKKGSGEEDYTIETVEMEGQSYPMRVAKALSQFFRKMIPIIREFNITIISINHINQKIEMNSFAKTQAQVLYLKADESLPGGNSPIYFANTLIKHIAVGASKANKEEHGYAGFRVNAEIIKSRTNISGVKVPMIYDQDSGFNNERTLLEYARDLGLVNGGRKNARYLGSLDTVKFNENDIVNEYRNREEVRDAFAEVVGPHLDNLLSRVGKDEESRLLENNEGIEADALSKILTDVSTGEVFD